MHWIVNFIIFGIVDNAVMIAGAILGLSWERFMPKYFQKGMGGVLGAGIGNAISDFMGGAITASWGLAFGTAIGCLIGLLWIPIFLQFQKVDWKKPMTVFDPNWWDKK